MNEETIKKLIKLANQAAWIDDDDFCSIYDYCGGNMDDAYYGGVNDGNILLAREILLSHNIKWNQDLT